MVSYFLRYFSSTSTEQISPDSAGPFTSIDPVGFAIFATHARGAGRARKRCFVSGDPVQESLVASFSHPGGNVTGVVTLLDLPTKQLGLRDMMPNAGVIACLINPDEQFSGSWIRDIQAAARAVAQQLLVLTATTEPHIDTAFCDPRRETRQRARRRSERVL